MSAAWQEQPFRQNAAAAIDAELARLVRWAEGYAGTSAHWELVAGALRLARVHLEPELGRAVRAK